MAADHEPLFVDDQPFRQSEAASIDISNPSFILKLELVLLRENTPDFVELINNLPSPFLDEKLNWIWRTVLYCDSGKCAAAVLDGQTKITELPLPPSSVSLLHRAAAFSAPKVTAVLLQRGFSADARGDYNRTESELKNVLPLHVVMTRMRSHLTYYNTKYEPPAIMLVKICKQDVRPILETIRLLALNTREVKREFFNYLKEGKMIEVGALLLVAKSQILSPSTTKGEGEFRSISEMHEYVLNTVCRLINTPLDPTKRNELIEMKGTLELLSIFDKIGDKLGPLLRFDFTSTCLTNCSTLVAASLIEDVGFHLDVINYDYSYARFDSLKIVPLSYVGSFGIKIKS